jgi:hypothetical protein
LADDDPPVTLRAARPHVAREPSPGWGSVEIYVGLPDASECDIRRDHRYVLHVVADGAVGHCARQYGARELGDHAQAYEALAAAGDPDRVVVEQPQEGFDVLGALRVFELGDPRYERRDVIAGVG